MDPGLYRVVHIKVLGTAVSLLEMIVQSTRKTKGLGFARSELWIVRMTYDLDKTRPPGSKELEVWHVHEDRET